MMLKEMLDFFCVLCSMVQSKFCILHSESVAKSGTSNRALIHPQWMIAKGYKRFTKVDLAEVLGRKRDKTLGTVPLIEEYHGEDNR